jgi:thioredoxin reductase (NADPH)
VHRRCSDTHHERLMARPIILTVDDDAAVSQAITRDLRARYADRYRIVRAA